MQFCLIESDMYKIVSGMDILMALKSKLNLEKKYMVMLDAQ